MKTNLHTFNKKDINLIWLHSFPVYHKIALLEAGNFEKEGFHTFISQYKKIGLLRMTHQIVHSEN